MTTLQDFPTRANSLNAIRLALAVCVLVSHAWSIGGFGVRPAWGQVSLGHFAVAGFFAISGWLITRSRLSSDLPTYAWRRFLRIYPGFFVALLVVAFGFAPLGSALGAGHWSVGDGLRHVAVNATMSMREFTVGETPMDVPYPQAWNGSLWTLFCEAACYVAVGLLLTVVRRRCFGPSIVVAWLALTVLAVAESAGGLHVSGFSRNFLELAPYFFAGAALFVLRSRVPLNGFLAGVSAAWVVAVLSTSAAPALAAVPIAYLMMWLGAVLPLRSVGRRNDISYGVYIYAFPVQQVLVLVGATAWGLLPYIALSILGTVPLAMFSWFAVERPAQRLHGIVGRLPLVGSRSARPADRVVEKSMAP